MKFLAYHVPVPAMAAILVALPLSTYGLADESNQHRRAQSDLFTSPVYELNEPARETPGYARNEPTAEPTAEPSKVPAPWFETQYFMTRRPTPFPTPSPSTRTPKPSPEPTKTPSQSPSLAPTQTPTRRPTVTVTRKPTLAPTDEPTLQPTPKPTIEPTDSPSANPSNPPTVAPTDGVTSKLTEAPSDGPTVQFMMNTLSPSQASSMGSTTEAPSTGLTQAVTSSSTNDLSQSSTEAPIAAGIVDQLQKMTVQFEVAFSLWSPDGIPKSGAEFEPISEAVLKSIKMLYCEDPLVSVCVLRDDTLLTSKETFVQARTVARYKTMAMLGIARVTAVEDETFTYTSWEVSFEMIQLGIRYVQEAIELSGQSQTSSIDELMVFISQNIAKKVTLDVEKSIREGTFDGLLHAELGFDRIVTAVPGEEYATFTSLFPNEPATNPSLQDSSTFYVEDGPDLALVAIYLAIAAVVIIFVAFILVFCYFKRQANRNARAEKDKKTVEEDESTSRAEDQLPQARPAVRPAPVMPSPSIATDSSLEDYSISIASYQRKPARFVLQPDPEPEQPDDGTLDFPTAGSIVAGSVMPESMMADSVESSLEGWSVHAAEIKWS